MNNNPNQSLKTKRRAVNDFNANKTVSVCSTLVENLTKLDHKLTETGHVSEKCSAQAETIRF